MAIVGSHNIQQRILALGSKPLLLVEMIEYWDEQAEPLEHPVGFDDQRAQATNDGYEGCISGRCVDDIFIEERQELFVRLVGRIVVEFGLMLLDIGLEDLDKVFGEWETRSRDEGLDSSREVFEAPIHETIISTTARTSIGSADQEHRRSPLGRAPIWFARTEVVYGLMG